MDKIETVIVFDIEFINQKDFYQPIQVSFCACKMPINNENIIVKENFYIKTLKNVKVNRFVTRYTGISDKTLEEEGIKFIDAKKRLLKFLKGYDTKTTILLGWDITNDLIMLNKLLSYRSLFTNINKYRWLDLSHIYKRLYHLPSLSSLKNACYKYDIEDKHMHNSSVDVDLTFELLTKLIEDFGEDKIFYQSTETKYKKRAKKKTKKVSK